MCRRILRFLGRLPAIGLLEVILLVAICAALAWVAGCVMGDSAHAAPAVEATNLLVNPGFEQSWDGSHECLILPASGDPYYADVGAIFTPPGWVTWFVHEPGLWDQPEARDAWKSLDPVRVHSGEKAMHLFTFYRRHDAGFLQQVPVTPGSRLRLAVWAHAWSNINLPGHESCFNDPRCSCGVGTDAAFILEGDAPPLNGDPWNDAIQNFAFSVGIDPTGGTDPRDEAVVWGRGAHIYNAHYQVPSVEVVAKSDVVTVFLRSRTLWSFCHNDAFWDDVTLESVENIYLPLVMGGVVMPDKTGPEVLIPGAGKAAVYAQ